MKKVFFLSLTIILLFALYSCSDDSNPITPGGTAVFNPFALWDTASGNLGEAVFCLAAKDSFIFAGTVDSGIYRSSNNGDSWTKINNGLPDLSIRAFLVKDSIIFAGILGNCVYCSTNNGSTWIAANTGISTETVLTIAQKDSIIFVGTYAGNVFRSYNNGLTWDDAGMYSQSINTLVVKNNKLFAGLDVDGIVYSTDRGNHWTPAVTGLTNYTVHSLAVRDTNLFAATDDGVFRSSDDSSWTEVNEGLYPIFMVDVPRVLFVYGSNILAGCGDYMGVYLSLNDGDSWVSANAGLPPLYVGAFTINGSYLFVGGQNQSGRGVVWRHAL